MIIIHNKNCAFFKLGLKEEADLRIQYEQETDSSNLSAYELNAREESEYAHILLKMGLEETIVTIYESDNMELIYYWVTRCLSNSTGKRKWNKFSCERRMKDFITFSDEAFAMLVLENNAKKWSDTVKYPTLKKRICRKHFIQRVKKEMDGQKLD